jgi:hypothetical protein
MDFAFVWLPILLIMLGIPFLLQRVPVDPFRFFWFADWLEVRGLWPLAQKKIGLMMVISGLLGIGFNSSIRQVAGIEPPTSLIPSFLAQLCMSGFLICSAGLRLLKLGTRLDFVPATEKPTAVPSYGLAAEKSKS